MQGIVLTGATSMLGVALIEECLRNGTRVLAIVRPNSSKIKRLPSSELLEICESDINELYKVKGTAEYDTFYHFGWQGTDRIDRLDPDCQLENVKYTLDAIRLAKELGCKVFVGAGSQAEYGRATEKLSAKTPINPEIAYGIAKYSACKLSAISAKEAGIKHIWARVLSVYGPYDGEHTMIMSGIRQLLNKQRPKYTKGEQLWDYLYCEDAAKAFYLMGEKPVDQAIYCLGSGQARPLRDFITIMRDAIDPSLEVGIGDLEYQKNQVMELCADISDLTRDTRFYPQVDFKNGIEKTINWYRETINS